MDERGNLTTGRVGKKLIAFCVPIIFANLIQAIYSFADMAIIGHYLGSGGMSAVSMGSLISTVVLVVVAGLSNGGSIISAQLIRNGAQSEIRRVLGSMLSMFTVIAIIITVCVISFAEPILRLINTPPAAFRYAVQYLVICMIGTIFVYWYNVLAAVLRGVGDSKTPMIIIAATAVLNIVLDIIAVGALNLGTAGAAMATIFSQFISVVLVCVLIKRKTTLFDFKLKSFTIHKNYLSAVVRIGLPQSIQFLFAAAGALFLGGLVNLYGVEASAAAGAVGKIQIFANLVSQGIMVGLMTMTAQNLAVGKPERVIKGLRIGMAFSTAISFVFFAFCMLFPMLSFRIFTSDAAVAAAGVGYLRCYAFSFVIEAAMFCMFGIISGAGYTPLTMCCGILSAFFIRYGFAWLFSNVLLWGFEGIGLAYVAAPIVTSVICVVFLLSGKWKVSRVKIQSRTDN
ncbi:MAG: MATE family efflux transporter [Clostridiales bacterium]|nr:MATE family efflux transporter [Clostridiales bacterium]